MRDCDSVEAPKNSYNMNESDPSKNISFTDLEAEKIIRPLFIQLKNGAAKNQAFQKLFEFCVHDNEIVKSHAVKMLLVFCESSPEHINYVVNGLITRLEFIKNSAIIIDAIGTLELLRLKFKLLPLPEHPFITILEVQQKSWIDVLGQIDRFILFPQNSNILVRNYQSLKIFLRISLASPADDPLFLAFKIALLDRLIQSDLQDKVCILGDLCEALALIQVRKNGFSDHQKVQDGILMVTKVLEAALERQNIYVVSRLIPQLFALCYKYYAWAAVILGHRCCSLSLPEPTITLMICYLAPLLLEVPSSQIQPLVTLVGNILTSSKPNTPSVCLLPGLMRIVASSFEDSQVSGEALNLVKIITSSSLDPVLGNTFVIELLDHTDTMCFDPSICGHLLALKLCIDLQADNSMKLPTLFKEGGALRDRVFPILISILLTAKSVKIIDWVLKELYAFIKKNNNTGHYLLLALLHKIQKTKDSEMKNSLFHFIPKLGCVKELVGPSLQLILTISSNVDLKYDGLVLLYELWLEEKRCFHYLHQMLLTEEKRLPQRLLLAQIIRDVCRDCDNTQSTQLLPLISSVLNSESPKGNTVLCQLMLDSIYHLCVHQIIDFQKAWKGIVPKLNTDGREPIVVWTCRFLSLLPDHCKDVDDPFAAEVITMLWGYTSSRSEHVTKAAYEGLSKFSPDYHQLGYIPSHLKTNVKFPKDLLRMVEEMNQPLEQCLDYVPGVVYRSILCEISEARVAYFMPFLNELVKWELENMPRGIYQSACQKSRLSNVLEPTQMDYLPHRSVLKECTALLKAEAKHTTRIDIIKALLTTLCSTGNRIPPFDWRSIAPFLKIEGLKTPCLTLFIKLLSYSPSAQQCVEDILGPDGIVELDLSEVVLDNVDKLIPNLPVPLVKGLLEHYLGHDALDHTTRRLFQAMSPCISEQDRDRLTMLCQLFKNWQVQIADKCVSPDTLEAFCDCIVSLPPDYLDTFTALTTGNLQLSLQIRLAQLKKGGEDRMGVFTDVIDFMKDTECDTSSLLDTVFSVCRDHLSEEEQVKWVLTVFYQIQGAQKDGTPQGLYLLLDVLSASLMGCAGVVQEYQPNQPNLAKQILMSLCFLLDRSSWASYSDKIFRWLLTLIFSPTSLPTPFRECFVKSFVLFRHCSDFQNPKYWKRIFRDIA